MEITEVRVRLVKNKANRLRAFCSLTLDNEFVVRDIRVVEATDGYLVAMPSRKMSDRCDKCGGRNHLRARFCNGCGRSLACNRTGSSPKEKSTFHTDIAHPINAACRQRIQEKVVAAFKKEMEQAQRPGYRSVEIDEPAE